MKASPEVECELLGNVLDGLDDLYDQRERADLWLERLLVASSLALAGTAWERRMADAAFRLRQNSHEQHAHDTRNRRALEITGDLRLQVSERWSDLYPSAASDGVGSGRESGP